MDRRSVVLCRRFVSMALVLAVFLTLPLTSFAQKHSDPDEKGKANLTEGVDKDDPLTRLKVQEEQNGRITPAYRDQVFREAQRHNQRMGRVSNGVDLPTPGQTANGPQWVNIGPFGQQFAQNGSFTGEFIDSGRLRTILPHPTDGNTVYVLTAAGGFWKSTDFEAAVPHWTPLTDFIETLAGGAAAFGRVPTTIYLGLGDPFDQITVGGAMVKSTDAGAHWTPILPLGLTVSVRDVKVDTSGTNDIVLVGTDGGLWRSTDSGVTYNQVTGFAFQDQYIWSLVQTSAGWVMTTQETQPITNGNCVVGTRWCTGAGHVYLSTDKGATWTEQTNGISGIGRTTLAVGTPGDAVIYAYAGIPNSGANPGNAQKDLYRSADGGKTWVALGVNSTKLPINPQPSYAPNMNVMSSQAWYNQTILVDPTDTTRNTVFLGGTLFSARTTDGGTNWKVLSEWLPGWAAANGLTPLPYVHADMHAMAYKPAGTAMVLLGSDGGIFASPDKGDTWTTAKNNNLATHLFYSLTGNPAFPSFVMGGLQDNGSRVRLDNTGIFNQTLGGDGFGSGFSQANSESAYQTVNGSVRRSRTQLPPKNGSEIEPSLAAQSDDGFYTPIYSPTPAADPSGLFFFSYGALQTNATNRIFFTSNGGLSWAVLNQVGRVGSGLPAGAIFRDNPFDFGISPTNLNHMAIGANGGRCFVSLDGGVTWSSNLATDSVAGWPGFVGNVTWASDTTIYVTSTSQTEGLYTGVPTQRVVKSTDQGLTWVAAGNGLPDVPVNKIQADPRDATGNTAYAGTHLGIYRTTDGGASWAPFGSSLPNVRVNDIYMPPDGGYMRIATYGRGIWQLSNLDYVKAALVDDGNTCDHDGNLGNNETGHLTLTFSNPGTAAITNAAVTVTSDNPHLSFTGGNNFTIPTIAANGTATATFAVTVTGAVGIETANLTIAYGSPTATIKQPIAFNYDDKAAASGTTVTFESTNHGWTFSNVTALKLGDNFFWERREHSPISHTMAVTNANAPQDVSLVSPQLKVGAGAFSFTFTHRYNFENTFDGGILEISTDGGATWNQIPAVSITVNPYNSLGLVAGAPGVGGKPAYTNKNTGWPAYITSTVDLGVTYANQNVNVRFRAGADDNTGRQGWEISGMSFTGLTNTPFGTYAAHNEACVSTASVVSLPNPSNFPDPTTFTATVLGGVTPVTGNVSFKEGATVLGTSAAVAGVASFTTSALAVGSHSIVASFAGDAGHAPVDSAAYKHTVLAVPRTSLTPNTLDFGDVHTGITSPVKTSILKNEGSAPLIITSIAVAGSGYAQTNNCSTSLAPGAPCTISVTFKPVGQQGTSTGRVTLTSNSISGDKFVTLTGNSVRGNVGFSKTAVSYANTLVGKTTAAQTVTVTNNGNLPLTITTVAVAGDFAKTDNCTAAPIAVGATCTINATFTPTAPGNRTGTVTLTDDADDSPQTIALSGKGEHVQISGTTTQTVAKTAVATFPVTLTASTTFAGPVTLACSGAPALTTCAFSNGAPTLAANGTANVSVTITPAPTTASNSRPGQIVFAMFGLFGLMLIPLTRKEGGRRVISMVILALMITVSVGGMVACGGDSTAATPHTPVTTFANAGTYNVTVTASSGATTLTSQTLTLTLQ
jgi:Bacterial Ig-like domain (group 3)/Protein of unknown function (DUF1573)